MEIAVDTKPKRIIIPIDFSEQDKELLKQLAFERNRSLAGFLRDLILRSAEVKKARKD